MKYLFQLNHPAHFHLFKNIIEELQKMDREIKIVTRNKDILTDLLSGVDAVNIAPSYRKKSKLSIVFDLLRRDSEVYNIAKNWKPDVMVGSAIEISHVGKILRIPSIFYGEDDVKLWFRGAILCYPFCTHIISPLSCDNYIWNKKTISYKGFQKLAYLHPNWFKPDRNKVHIPFDKRFFILRFSGLNAFHDTKANGINNSTAEQIIELLKPHGEILISSERELPEKFENYRFQGNVKDIHHYLYYADLYLGDSQSMAVETAMLGTPGIRFNNFVGKIGVLEEIEKEYKLSFGFSTDDKDMMLEKVKEIAENQEYSEKFRERREKLLNDKIDVCAFFVWFLDNYPKSVKILKDDPSYQDKFK